jgi:hypothetical protein
MKHNHIFLYTTLYNFLSVVSVLRQNYKRVYDKSLQFKTGKPFWVISWLLTSSDSQILSCTISIEQYYIHWDHVRDCMVVGFTTTCAITTKVVSSNPIHDEVHPIQHYVIKFVSDLWQVCGFIRELQFPPTIKLTVTI